MSEGNLLLVVNPYAGRQGRYVKRVLPQVLQVGEKYGQIIAAQSLEELRRQLTQSLLKKPQVVAVFGGDGSVHEVFTILLQTLSPEDFPLILPLRGGTMNCFAQDVGTHDKRPDRILQKIMTRMEAGEKINVSKRGVLRCQIEPDDKVFYCQIYANGLPYEGLKEFYSRTNSISNAVWVLLDVILRPSYRKRIAHFQNLKIGIDGHTPQNGQYQGIYASTLHSAIMGFRPFFEKIADPDRQFSFLFTKMSVGEMVGNLPAVLWGLGKGQLNPEKYSSKTVEEVVLEAHEGFTLDGELYPMDTSYKVTLRVETALKVPIVE